jgi:pimeloyl-ACP methyl ester carboxylesterase
MVEVRRYPRMVKAKLRGRYAMRVRRPKDSIKRLFLSGVQSDLGNDSRTLLVAFGGLRGRIDVPRFEFSTITGDFPVKRLFVRDLDQAWYHRGAPRTGAKTLEELAQALERMIAAQDVDRIVTIGNSSGGYAALAFGALLGADCALSFAPQTVIDPDALRAMGDKRWLDKLTALESAGALDHDWLDLRTALPSSRRRPTRYQIYFDTSHRVDRLHAENLREVDGVRLYPFGHGGHYLVNRMRASGALERVLRDALGAPRASAGVEIPETLT